MPLSVRDGLSSNSQVGDEKYTGQHTDVSVRMLSCGQNLARGPVFSPFGAMVFRCTDLQVVAEKVPDTNPPHPPKFVGKPDG